MAQTFLPTEELTELAPFPPQTWRRWRSTGFGPPYIKVGNRVLYDRDEVLAWLASKRFTSTADEQAAKQLQPRKRRARS